MDIDYSNAPADESQYEEYKDNVLEDLVKSLRKEFETAKKRHDLDMILKKYKIKIMRNKKRVSPLQEKMEMKRRIITFAIHEPEDIFDIDTFNNHKK